jgi:hypothetical protein
MYLSYLNVWSLFDMLFLQFFFDISTTFMQVFRTTEIISLNIY